MSELSNVILLCMLVVFLGRCHFIVVSSLSAIWPLSLLCMHVSQSPITPLFSFCNVAIVNDMTIMMMMMMRRVPLETHDDESTPTQTESLTPFCSYLP